MKTGITVLLLIVFVFINFTLESGELHSRIAPPPPRPEKIDFVLFKADLELISKGDNGTIAKYQEKLSKEKGKAPTSAITALVCVPEKEYLNQFNFYGGLLEKREKIDENYIKFLIELVRFYTVIPYAQLAEAQNKIVEKYTAKFLAEEKDYTNLNISLLTMLLLNDKTKARNSSLHSQGSKIQGNMLKSMKLDDRAKIRFCFQLYSQKLISIDQLKENMKVFIEKATKKNDSESMNIIKKYSKKYSVDLGWNLTKHD